MQEPLKFCSACGTQNNLSAEFCQKCGTQYSGAPPPVQPRPKRDLAATLLIVVVGVFFGCCGLSGAIGLLRGNTARQPADGAGLTDSPAPAFSASSPLPSPTPLAWTHLTVVKSNWERGGFGSIAMWHVTFKNNSDRPIGDIQYRTIYYSETGNVVDKGGIDSPLDKKIIQRVIPAKSTRTVEVNDGFVHSEGVRARFELVDCRFVADSR